MAAQYFGLPIIGAAALGIILLERRFPYDPRQKLLREGFWTDLLGYGVFQSYLLGLVIAEVIAWLDGATGLSRLQLVSGWPLWLQCLGFFVMHDAYIYGFHRLQHHNRYLWRTHEAHHSGRDVDWLSGTRSHALEILINQTVEFAPIVLLGAAPEVAVFKGVIDAVWGMYIHSNLDVRSGALQYVINGPEMHRFHHAANRDESSANFATKLAIWDWLFGTAYLPGHKPARYGLWDGADFPASFFAQQCHAFRAFEAVAEPDPDAALSGCARPPS
jgi:sterol desaturase/sphingolipid hydroxylase (fatty acid hydroxylase superfamily)